MPGLGPGIHDLRACHGRNRGWPGQARPCRDSRWVPACAGMTPQREELASSPPRLLWRNSLEAIMPYVTGVLTGILFSVLVLFVIDNFGSSSDTPPQRRRGGDVPRSA